MNISDFRKTISFTLLLTILLGIPVYGYAADCAYTFANNQSKLSGTQASNSTPNLISVSSAIGKNGDSITIDVSVSNNQGILNAGIRIIYDTDALKLLNVSDGGILGYFCGSKEPVDLNQSPYKLVWINPGEEDNLNFNYTEDGVLATLTFQILIDAEPGDYTIGIAVDQLLKNTNGKLTTSTYTNSTGSITAEYNQMFEWNTDDNKLSCSTNILSVNETDIYAAFYDYQGKLLGISAKKHKENGYEIITFDDINLIGITAVNYQSKIKATKIFTLKNFKPLSPQAIF